MSQMQYWLKSTLLIYFQKLASPDKKGQLFKVIGQPMQVETLSVYDVSDSEAAELNMKHAFVLVETNKFEQTLSVHTLQANTSLGKVIFL